MESITSSRQGGNVQDLDFQFDTLGNLKERTAYRQSALLTENFTYDDLNRLKTSVVAGTNEQKNYNYDALGNITFKTGVGYYTYGAATNAGPHAVTQTTIGSKDYTYDANGNMEYGDGRNITWSPYNKPVHITQNGSTIATIKSFDNGTAKETRYLHKDHLGGIETITNESAGIMSQLSYDPHGKRRNVDWTDANGSLPTYDTNRGFTGHEHLDDVGLIHMNGRVYDPTLGCSAQLNQDTFLK